jgi:hypothetical protein
MVVLGNDRVVIGAPADDTAGLNSGTAYVFSLNGTLLATINNPAPGIGDGFGSCLAAFGNDAVVIGAPGDGDVGSAYLFSIPAATSGPSLAIRRTTTNTVVISWPSPSTGFVLQQNTNLSTTNWAISSESVTDNGTTKSISASPGPGNRLYRLFKP